MPSSRRNSGQQQQSPLPSSLLIRGGKQRLAALLRLAGPAEVDYILNSVMVKYAFDDYVATQRLASRPNAGLPDLEAILDILTNPEPAYYMLEEWVAERSQAAEEEEDDDDDTGCQQQRQQPLREALFCLRVMGYLESRLCDLVDWKPLEEARTPAEKSVREARERERYAVVLQILGFLQDQWREEHWVRVGVKGFAHKVKAVFGY
ncbi:hypothetical protein F4778DRAFT_727753 [Xylariomycetidae sp. FL2044]|nr:hypothetical protein F4778DRAFT_727753 [Xylariomycetidae sp. FL2044]